MSRAIGRVKFRGGDVWYFEDVNGDICGYDDFVVAKGEMTRIKERWDVNE